MELEDCAFKNLKNVEFGVSPKDEERIFKGEFIYILVF
jgi:hypothetical protein